MKELPKPETRKQIQLMKRYIKGDPEVVRVRRVNEPTLFFLQREVMNYMSMLVK